MLSREQSYMIRCLADWLRGRQTDAPDGVDIAMLSCYAQQQQVEGIVYVQSKLPELKSAFAASSYYAVTRRTFLQKVHNEFEKENIPYLIFKGTEIARYYPVSALRTMGDSDILVHPENKQRAHEILLSLGLKNKCLGPNEWIYYTRDGTMEYELHHRLMNDELVSLPSHKPFMERVWANAESPDGTQYRLDPTYHLAFVLLHLRKHFMNSGVGFRYFMDAAVMAEKAEIEWDRFWSYIDELEMTEFVKTCFAFIHRWFGMKLPVDCIELDDDFFETATEQIFENGIFGFSDAGNRDNYLMIQIKQDTGRVGLFLRKLFPRYEHLSSDSRYSFLKGKPWLLPAAWVYRPVAAVLHGTAKSGLKRAAAPFSVSTARMLERRKYLKKWNLNR